jgi:glycosyltransferase involved in cell wall biosynthesis
MNIGIDARAILNPDEGDDIGIGHYTYQLLRHLLDADSKNRYTIFFDYRVRQKDVGKFARPNSRVRFYPFSDYKKYLPVAYSELLGQAALTREHFDVLHSTSPLSRIPLLYRGKCVTTFHNMGVFKEPQCYPSVRRTREQALSKYMAKKSDSIIAVSESLRDDLRSILSEHGDKVAVIHGGLDGRYFQKSPDPARIAKSRFGVDGPYVFFLGTLDPINNVMRLLEAFAKFKKRWNGSEKKPFPYRLVLSGKRGWLSGEHRQAVKDFGLSNDVVFTGYVSGEDAASLFQGSEFFIMPSLYEGFGTTVLEAMACGTPVIASRVSSLPEIAGDAALFVNPVDIDGIVGAMWEMSHDGAMREEFRRKGYAQAKKFGWDRAARQTLDLYAKTADLR